MENKQVLGLRSFIFPRKRDLPNIKLRCCICGGVSSLNRHASFQVGITTHHVPDPAHRKNKSQKTGRGLQLEPRRRTPGHAQGLDRRATRGGDGDAGPQRDGEEPVQAVIRHPGAEGWGLGGGGWKPPNTQGGKYLRRNLGMPTRPSVSN